MTQQQMIAAITSSLQTADSNGEFSNVILLLQAIIINGMPNYTITQLQTMCTVLNINTSE